MTGIISEEHELQKAIIRRAKLNYAQYPELRAMYAIVNAGKRSFKMTAWYKAEGMRTGMPDLCLPISRGGYSALYIENKVGNGKLTNEQIYRIALLGSLGNCVHVCYSADDAWEKIVEYLEM